MATAVIPPGPVGQPDISYQPDYESYLLRIQRRLDTERLDKTLPDGFPAQLNSGLVWDGRDLAQNYDWNYVLTPDDVAELEAALAHFKSLNLALGYLTQETFPLPKLHHTLRDVSREIHLGHGFKVVRGIPVDRYSREDNITIYTGIAAHVAPLRGRQGGQMDGAPADVMLTHIKDLSEVVDHGEIGTPAYTTDKQVFHTDAGDVIALMALGEPEEGGESYLSSSWKVYNELAAARPDLIRTLAGDWIVDDFDKQGQKYTVRPLLHLQPATGDHPQRLIIQYARRAFTGYWGLPRSAGIPPITEAHAEALDALHFTAEKYSASLGFRKGDIQFANNLSIFHARNGFRDSKEKTRHLVRLWLRDPEYAWDTPETLQPVWDRVYGDVRPERTVFPLDPIIRQSGKVVREKEIVPYS